MRKALRHFPFSHKRMLVFTLLVPKYGRLRARNEHCFTLQVRNYYVLPCKLIYLMKLNLSLQKYRRTNSLNVRIMWSETNYTAEKKIPACTVKNKTPLRKKIKKTKISQTATWLSFFYFIFSLHPFFPYFSLSLLSSNSNSTSTRNGLCRRAPLIWSFNP